jgi:hypothetical protein
LRFLGTAFSRHRLFLYFRNMLRLLMYLLVLLWCENAQAQDTARRRQPARMADSVQRRTVPARRDSAARRVTPVRRDTARIATASADTTRRLQATTDTALRAADSLRLAAARADSLRKDSIRIAHLKPTWQQDTAFTKFFRPPYMPERFSNSVVMVSKPFNRTGNEFLFYLLVGIVAFAGIIKTFFSRYFSSLFRLFVETSFRQKHTQEQGMQNMLPNFLMNILFVLSAGTLLGIVALRNFHLPYPPMLIVAGAIVLVLLVYLFKLLFIHFCGWVFQASREAFDYSFIVFLVNKIMGVLFIPIVLVLAYANADTFIVVSTVAAFITGALLLYRYAAAFAFIKGNLKINLLQFFVYFCAVELIPVLLIYKTAVNFLGVQN